MRWLTQAGLILVIAAMIPAAQAKRLETFDVVVDMTPEGHKVAPPSPDKPVYYLPILGGYKEMGATYAGEAPPPPSKEVARLVALALADQGYYSVKGKMGKVKDATGRETEQPVLDGRYPPSLILIVHWGSINPEIDNSDPSGDPSQQIFYNQGQMLALVGGNTLNNLDLNFEKEDVMQAAEDDRYFVVVSAYDYQPYAQAHKKVLLWKAKMSVPTNGVTLAQVMPALIKAGGPLFGRETIRPKMITAPITPQGTVEIGVPKVVDYQDAPLPPVPPAAPKSK